MKISVVMPSYNQARFVESALRSVIEQDYPDKEILFVDGGSTDETMRIIEGHAQEIAYCVSEPDKGQSDALRKGFERANGDILTWLNTDDILLPGALSEVAQSFIADAALEWAFGNVIWIDPTGHILKCRKGENYWSIMPRLGVLSACGPSAFFTRDLLERVGGVNLDLHYMMDTELWWRFIMSGAKFHRLERYTWALRLHENAKMSGHLFKTGEDAVEAKAARVKRCEQEHIRRLTSEFRSPLSRYLARPLQAIGRVCSPRYLAGLRESRTLRGRHIDQLEMAP